MDDRNTRIITKIINYAEKVLSYCEGVNEASFISDTKLVEACVFNLLQIGELARHLNESFIKAHGDIAWSQMRGLRNRIVHDYHGIDLLLIWDIIASEKDGLVELIKKLTNLREKLY